MSLFKILRVLVIILSNIEGIDIIFLNQNESTGINLKKKLMDIYVGIFFIFHSV